MSRFLWFTVYSSRPANYWSPVTHIERTCCCTEPKCQCCGDARCCDVTHFDDE